MSLYERNIYSSHITTFIQQVAKFVDDILNQTNYHQLLFVATQLCETNSHRWKLLKTMKNFDQTLEMLIVSYKKHHLLQNWISTFNKNNLDVVLLKDWIRRLVILAQSCENHQKIFVNVTRWWKLESLKNALQEIVEESRTSNKNTIMTLTFKIEFKKSKFDDDIFKRFAKFEFAILMSFRMCDNHLNTLDSSEALTILKKILTFYSCSFCQNSLTSDLDMLNVRSNSISRSQKLNNIVNLFDVIDNNIKKWRLQLSSRALQDLRRFEFDSRIMKAFENHLIDLIVENAKSTLVKFKNEFMIISLWEIKWRLDTISLWQVDVVFDSIEDMKQQVIKIWTIKFRKLIRFVIKKIMLYQKSLLDATIARCLDVNAFLKMWNHHDNSMIFKVCVNLNIKLVDQKFIDTFNKFFIVIEILLQSIIQQNFNVEFSFDLFSNEMRIIQHFHTSTFILERSDIEKTTCLVFKMIAKYLASCRVSSQKSSRQICALLYVDDNFSLFSTNIDFLKIFLIKFETLTKKLQTYSKRLMSTLTQQNDVSTSQMSRDIFVERIMLQLEFDDFSLVCIYEQFLFLIKNNIQTLERSEWMKLITTQTLK